ncbi:hypothetical protein GCM10011575_35650 [Microlunatus endophyticus]|uniref:Hydrolase of the HAD superfamily n=1 Tax=Microlunatus endophyticus TaxID=1716077 RepID=A0A917SFU3_9ACTN|nr:HAD-IA family hydrolase [Microlunatus endophyticus]GGL74273.1 hypothetical protein GCM10011575_35650 [Microlunatus endophyticus]
MQTTIRWILFDADGVLQRSADGWQDRLLELLGDASTLEELFAAEREQTMTGGNFRQLVTDELACQGVQTDPEVVLDVWRDLIVDEEMTARIGQLRAGGLKCALATNQQDVRVAHMRSMPEYDGVFDAQFYSSEVGLAKPDPAFFAQIVQQLGVPTAEVLFIDDVRANVDGAGAAGLHAEVFEHDAGVGELDRILAAYGLVGR